VWPEAVDRISKLNAARDRIATFRNNYLLYLELNAKARAVLGKEIDAIYRECQEFATTRIKEAVEDVLRVLVPAKPGGV
jgi:proline dehydrogenase